LISPMLNVPTGSVHEDTLKRSAGLVPGHDGAASSAASDPAQYVTGGGSDVGVTYGTVVAVAAAAAL